MYKVWQLYQCMHYPDDCQTKELAVRQFTDQTTY